MKDKTAGPFLVSLSAFRSEKPAFKGDCRYEADASFFGGAIHGVIYSAFISTGLLYHSLEKKMFLW
jgi:hypothetical protein